MNRVGIYAGTFDPVHSGHVAFALQALEFCKLDHVYFLPERRPQAKVQATHYAHRVAMLREALKPHSGCSVLELVDAHFTVKKTLSRLKQQLPDNQLAFLFGSDIVPGLMGWPNAGTLLSCSELVIGLRGQDDRAGIKKLVASWQAVPKEVTIFDSYAPMVSSSQIRSALRQNRSASGILKSVERYSNNHWLYVSLSDIKSSRA